MALKILKGLRGLKGLRHCLCGRVQKFFILADCKIKEIYALETNKGEGPA